MLKKCNLSVYIYIYIFFFSLFTIFFFIFFFLHIMLEYLSDNLFLNVQANKTFRCLHVRRVVSRMVVDQHRA